jgi:hypothetical protein
MVRIKTYRRIILSEVLYGYQAWSLVLKEEHRLRMNEKRVRRITFGRKRRINE